MKLPIRAAVAGLALTVFVSVSAAADRPQVVVDFESLPHEYELEGVGDIVSEHGFTFVYSPAPDEPYPVGFFSVGPSWAFNLRSTALNSNSCSSTVSLVADNSQTFSINSIDLAPLNGDEEVLVTFTGFRSRGANVSHTMRLKHSSGWKTFKFPGSFRNLEMLSWKQGDCVINKPHMFDNLVLSETSTEG